jgi:hypothetical protein
MKLGLSIRPRLRSRHAIVPVVIVALFTLSACGGSSSKATGTSVASSSTVAAAGTVAAATSTATESSTVATATASGGATGAATTATTAATTAPTIAPTPTVASTKPATTTASGDSTGVPLTSSNSVMQQVADAWKALKSYKMTLTTYDVATNTQTGTATMETMLPDKAHWTMDQNGQKIELILVDGASYIKIGDTWTQTPGSLPSSLPDLSDNEVLNTVETPVASSDAIAKKGTETVNGVECDVYEVTGDSGSTTLWIGQKDHLLYKGSFEDSGTRTEIVLSDFNKDFDIKAPI